MRQIEILRKEDKFSPTESDSHLKIIMSQQVKEDEIQIKHSTLANYLLIQLHLRGRRKGFFFLFPKNKYFYNDDNKNKYK